MINSFSKYWPWFFLTAAFESLVAIAALFLIPSEGGLSFARIALLGVLIFVFGTATFLGFRARQNSAQFDSFASTPFIASMTLLFLTSGLSLFLLRYLNPERLLPYYERVAPLLWLLLIVAMQAIIFLNLVKNGFHPDGFSAYKSVYVASLFFFCLLISLFTFVAITRIGIKPDTAYWGEPGVAIQSWQFVVSIVVGILVAAYMQRNISYSSRCTNVFIPLLLYGIACALWLGVPNEVLESSFYAPVSPPAYMPFPYSDAGFYDYLSQSLLIGTNYLNGIPPRPFYILFLAVLHYFFGQNYPAIIAAQTFVLALFPVGLYFLAKRLHSPSAGVTIALFAIFRELTALWISSNTRVVNSKMFTTDFPTAMVIVFTCLVMLWWLERRDLKSTLVAGGAFGLLLLFRTQSLLILPVIFALAWFVYQRKTKSWIIAGVIFALGFAVTILPWLIHNYTISGMFSFDDPQQVAIIYSQYSTAENLDISQFDPEKDSVSERLVSFALQNPAYVARFISTHFLNTEIGGLLSLPLIKPFEGLSTPVNLYWVGWNGALEWYNIALLIFYLVVIAIGLGISWRRMGWIGLLPLAFNLGYALANGIARFSSWRYNLPVDWVIYFYFGIGVLEIFLFILSLLGAKSSEADVLLPNEHEISIRDFRPQYIFILIAFSLVGSLPWLAKGFFPQPRYISTQEQLVARLDAHGYSSREIGVFLSQQNAILLEGRLLYPRRYSRGRGMSSANPWPAYAVQDYSRIGFIVLNDHQYQSVFITRDSVDFPQGADVIVLGCQRDGYIEVRIVGFGSTTFESAPLTQSCD